MNPVVRLARQQILRLLDGQRVQVPTSVGLLDVEAKADDRWTPLKNLPMAEAITAAHVRLNLKPPDELWANDVYEVFVSYSPEGGRHLSIKRYDRAAVHNWRHFQQIKNEVCGDEFEAMEVYPAESRIADNANQYHLWVMPEGVTIPVGYGEGFVTIADDEVADYNEGGGAGRQEPMQPGLTVGTAMDARQRLEGISETHEEARKVNKR